MNTKFIFERALIPVALLATSCAIGAEIPRPAGQEPAAASLGGALPGGAILSARSVLLQPAGGGPVTAVPLSADGRFTAIGLAPGGYQLRISTTTVPRQTQGTTFGEKVQSGLQAAGGALAQGASRSGISAAASMPARISMNVTVGRQTQPLAVDGDAITVSVAQDGKLEGLVKAP